MNEKILTNCLYSLDKLTVEFEMLTEVAQTLMDSYSLRSNVDSWVTGKLSVCRYNYRVNCSDDNSFWIGFQPNWKKGNKYITVGRVEFNPSKLGSDMEFLRFYSQILSRCNHLLIKPIKFDLAIDLPVSREKVYLLKDKRTYEEYSNSFSDRTQYLGPRNSHGRVKLYNKSLESKLNIPLTRLELTIDYAMSSLSDVQCIIPNLYILDSFQFDIDVTGTDKVILIAVLQDISLLNELSRRKQQKIKAYLDSMQLKLELKSSSYQCILNDIKPYLKL